MNFFSSRLRISPSSRHQVVEMRTSE